MATTATRSSTQGLVMVDFAMSLDFSLASLCLFYSMAALIPTELLLFRPITTTTKQPMANQRYFFQSSLVVVVLGIYFIGAECKKYAKSVKKTQSGKYKR